MSLALNPVPTVLSIDPVTAINQEIVYAVRKGGIDSSYQVIPTTSASQSRSQFTVPPPSPNTITDLSVMLVQGVTFNFSSVIGANVGENLINSNYSAPRSYPLSQNMSSLEADFNGTKVTNPLYLYIEALLRFNQNVDVMQGQLSLTPCYPDCTQNYSDLDALSIANPMKYYGDGLYNSPMGRGAFPIDGTITNTRFSATLHYTFCEPLMIQPFSYGTNRQRAGAVGLQQMVITINWLNDLRRMWSDNSSARGITDLVITPVLDANPALLFHYVSASNLMKIPAIRSYPYVSFMPYNTSPLGLTTVAPGATASLTSNSLQLLTVPNKWYIYVRQSDQTRTFKGTDTYFSIESVSINWANRTSMLGSANSKQLYLITKNNGISMSYPEWSGTSQFLTGGTNQQFGLTGSILCLTPFDIPSSNEVDSAGVNGCYNFQITVNCRNINQTTAINPELIIITETSGIFSIANNSSYFQSGIVSREDSINVISKRSVSYYDVENHAVGQGFAGGAISLSDIKKFGNDAFGVLKKGCDYSNSVCNTVNKLAPMFGHGDGMDPEILGGRSVSRKSLKSRLNY